MPWFNFSSKKRPAAQGFAAKRKGQELPQAFILEPILTPSGLLDGTDNPIDIVDIDISADQIADIDIPEIEEGFGDSSDNDLGEIPFVTSVEGEETLEEIPFVTSLDDVAESEATDEALTEETPLNASLLTGLDSSSVTFESGVFTVGQTGEVSVDFLFDGGGYEGELAVFSLEGMEEFEPGSEAFIQEAASRALSDSELGHVVISDQTEGARFVGELGESDRNSGEYLGVKTVQMRPGDEFGFMLVPNNTVQRVFDNPDVGGAARPLFSMATANPDDGFHVGQIADVTGDGSTFVMEDMRVDTKSDGDYNDVIFQVSGATGEAALMDEVIESGKDWRETDLGQELVDYAIENLADTDTGDTDSGDIDSGDTNPDETDPVEPVVRYEFPEEDQPLIGVIDTGFSDDNPDIDYSQITLGSDRVDNDSNPLLVSGEGNEHGTHVLGIIAAQQDNDIGIDGINDDAPLWVGRAVGSGEWAESLVEFVDTAKESSQPNAVVNLSLDLTQVNPDGSVTTRYEFTPEERAAIEYARQNGVLIVVAAGNDGDVMSVLGQASQEFDNIITVGAADGLDRATYSSYGYGLDILAPGGTSEYPVLSTTGDGLGTMAGTSVASAQVTGAVSQVWAANPQLSYRQVIEVVKSTATDLQTPGWDMETGAGLLNLVRAVELAKTTTPEDYQPKELLIPQRWSGEGTVTPTERAADETQPWIRQLGTGAQDTASSVVVDSSGNIYMVGSTQGSFAETNAGNYDVWIAKYNDQGTLQWKQQFGTPSYDGATNVEIDKSGNIYITGVSEEYRAGFRTRNTQAWITKYTDKGTLEWQHFLETENEDYPRDIALDDTGNVYICGETNGSLPGNNSGELDAWVAKYDNQGNLQWKKELGNSGKTTSSSVAVDKYGNIYIGGGTSGSLAQSNVGKQDAWIAKYNNQGTLQWKHQIGTTEIDSTSDVAVDSLGNIYISGVTKGSLAGTNAGDYDTWIAKYNSQGIQQWKQQFGTAGKDTSYSDLALDKFGNIYIAGSTEGSLAATNTGKSDAWIAKYNSQGVQQWKYQLGTSASDGLGDVTVNSLGNVFAVGYTYGALGTTNAGLEDAWMAKFVQDTAGNLQYPTLLPSLSQTPINQAPTGLSFKPTKYTNELGEPIQLENTKVYDENGISDLSKIDFWLQKDQEQWQDIPDATTFTPQVGDEKWGSFNYQLNDLEPGFYRLYGTPVDKSGAQTNTHSLYFRVVPKNDHPQVFKVSTDKSNYNLNDKIRIEGKVYDSNGTQDLRSVSFWVKRGDEDWDRLGRTSQFTQSSSDPNLAIFNYESREGALDPGNYQLKVIASDNRRSESTPIFSNFMIDGAGNTLNEADNFHTLTSSSIRNVREFVGDTDTQDYYRFYLEKNSDINIQLEELDADVTLQLLQLKSNGTTRLIDSLTNSNSDTAEFQTDDLPAGVYYIGVAPSSAGNNTHYKMKLSANPDVGWVVIPLKISSGALMGANNLGILSGNRSVQGSVGGADSSNLYRFEMPKTGQFDLSVTNMIANANVQLIDSQGNVIDKSGNSENQTESINRTLTAGTYYIQIYTTRKNADRTYVSTDYTLNLSSPVVYIPPPGDGLGDTLSTARNLGTLGTEKRISNSVGNDDPSDYYRFNLSDRKRFRSVLFPLETDEKANFELLDSNGNIIAQSSIQNGVGNLNKILDKGTYYFHVYQANGTKASYNLFLHGLPAPASSVSAQVPSNHWKAEYFNNRDLAGNPVHVEDFGDGSQNFEYQWGLGSPTNTPSDNFSARITTQRYFPEGKYQIKVNADDGVRVRIGNQLVIDKWQDQGFDPLRTGYFHSNGGQYPVTVEYYEKGGAAALKFDIESFNSFEEPASNGSEWNSSFFWWDKEQGDEPPVNFYENQDNFIGVVSLGSNQRSDGQNGIHLNLGDRFPQDDSRLPHDFFALRSYTHADFEKGKRYRILVKADDGFQLLAKHHWLPDDDPNKWVDITSKYHWQQAYDSYKVIDFEVPNSGKYDLHFHLYEAGGDAYMDLAWGEIVGNFMVSGDFYNAYKNRRELGNPTSEVFDSGNGTFKQNFEHGYIFWNGQSAQVYQTGSGKPSQPSNSFQTGRVNSQVGSLPLRLRNEPSTIGTTTLDLLYQGTTFKIIRPVSSSDPNWHSWYEVEANGKHGYVAADYVDVISNNNSNNPPNPTPQPVISSDFSGTVMNTGINVRSQPSVHNQQVGYLSPGSPLIFDAWTRSTSHRDGITNQWDNKWFRIKDTDTWVASAYIIGNPTSNTPYIEFSSNQSPQPNPNPQPQPQPISGMPDFSLPAYREDNLFWRSGYAPKSTNPPFTNLGNAKGNCTWYVNGRLQQLGYDPSILSNLTSNADRWDDQARAAGIYMSRTPQVGAIAQWESGHVAVVERVNSDGTIVISESSYSPVSGSSYDYLYNTRTISAASPSTYIHVPSSEISSGSNSNYPQPQPTPPPKPITGWGEVTKDGITHPVGFNRVDGSLTDIRDQSTWIVIHGMNSKPSASGIAGLANAIGNYRNDDQVFTLDWSKPAFSDSKLEINGQNVPNPKFGASWITQVAEFAAKKIDEWKISLDNINVIGHSLGSFVSYELAKYFKNRRNINSLIALDPATTTFGGYADGDVNFSNYSDWAWGFYGSILGSDTRANTAEESFKFDFGGFNPEKHHGSVVEAFTEMIEKINEKQAGNVSKLFDLQQMNNESGKPWQRHDGFEAVLKPKEVLNPKEEDVEWKPSFLEYYKGGWDGLWNWPDVWE